MNTRSKVNALKLKGLLERYPEDKVTARAAKSLDTVREALADLENKRVELSASGFFTPEGVYKELAPWRARHAEALRAQLDVLEKAARPLAEARQAPANAPMPEQSERILLHFNQLPLTERNHAIAMARAGKDEELRR